MKILWILISLCVLWPQTTRAELTLSGGVVVFASVERGRQILESDDEYTGRMSTLDRSVRMKTERAATKEEYLAFAGGKVRQWEPWEMEKVDAALLEIRPGMEGLAFPGIAPLYLIKTSGEEEGNAAYTRGNSVVLPESAIRWPGHAFKRLLAHELFHILSRDFPSIREALYSAIGFQFCGEAELPQGIRSRRMTNPDAPRNDQCIRVQINGKDTLAVPVLFSLSDRYDAKNGGDLFNYLTSGFLEVKKGESSGQAAEAFRSEDPLVTDVERIQGFFEQVGRNTSYIIHPEEILADNFALLALGEKNVPNPEILEKMKGILLGIQTPRQRELP